MKRDIVLIGASAGGVEALRQFLPQLPPELRAAVFITAHLPAHSPNLLPKILQPLCRLPVLPAIDGAPVRHGIVTVAVSDQHLMFSDSTVRLTRGPRENRARPSIDVTFRSAALNFGPRCIGVVLSGMLDDGTAGLWTIADQGGATVVQHPEDAGYPSMPRSAIANVAVQHTVRASELAEVLNGLTREEVDVVVAPMQSHLVRLEEQMAEGTGASMAELGALGVPSLNTCPHCNGVLLRISGTAPPRFRCHTGHAFTPTSLLVDLDATIEDKLWQILRSIDERIILLRQLRDLANGASDETTAQEYARQIEDAISRAQSFRQLLQQPSGLRATP